VVLSAPSSAHRLQRTRLQRTRLQRAVFSEPSSASHLQRAIFSAPSSAHRPQRAAYSAPSSASHLQRAILSAPSSASRLQRTVFSAPPRALRHLHSTVLSAPPTNSGPAFACTRGPWREKKLDLTHGQNKKGPVGRCRPAMIHLLRRQNRLGRSGAFRGPPGRGCSRETSRSLASSTTVAPKVAALIS